MSWGRYRAAWSPHDPDTGVRDHDMLRTILRYRGARSGDDLATPVDHLPDGGKVVFGVYAAVVTPGRVRVGDAAGLRDSVTGRVAASAA